MSTRHTGTVSANPRGFGFAVSDDAEHFIPPGMMCRLVPGDLIEFDLEPGGRPGGTQVCDITVLRRPSSIWLGEAQLQNGRWILSPDEACFIEILLEDVEYIAPGLVVSARIPEGTPMVLRDFTMARIERILGPRDRPGFELDYALAKHDARVNFSPEALCQTAAITAAASMGHTGSDFDDLRDIPFVTIDGEQTADFDDAVWVERVDGGWRAMVGIASVSTYVREGTPLDREARRRGTSIYLPGRCVPMLPEALSAGLCSLSPGEERLALVVTLSVSEMGEVTEHTFRSARIRSAARLTYTQASSILAGTAPAPSEPVLKSLKAMHGLYLAVDAQRRAQGLALERDEVDSEVVIDNKGHRQVQTRARGVSSKIVEVLMLLANKAAAQTLRTKIGDGVFRHQPPPAADDWQELRIWCSDRGISLADTPSVPAIVAMLAESDRFSGRAVAEMRYRKAMSPAHYSNDDPSHFTLGFEHYTHFTSPIRRYADLVVHRLLIGDYVAPEQLAAIAEECSKRSHAARLAEREAGEAIRRKLLIEQVSQNTPLKGRVVALSRKGARVLLRDWQCSVLVSASELLEFGYRLRQNNEWRIHGHLLEPGADMTVKWRSAEECRGKFEVQATLA